MNILPLRTLPPITFTDDDFNIHDPDQEDPIVILATITNWQVHKILVDQGSSVDVLYWYTFLKLNIHMEMVKLYSDPLVGFVGERVYIRGFIDLLMTFGNGRAHRTQTMRYSLVEADTSYSVLIGRRTLNALGAIISTPHMAMKFLSK